MRMEPRDSSFTSYSSRRARLLYLERTVRRKGSGGLEYTVDLVGGDEVGASPGLVRHDAAHHSCKVAAPFPDAHEAGRLPGRIELHDPTVMWSGSSHNHVLLSQLLWLGRVWLHVLRRSLVGAAGEAWTGDLKTVLLTTRRNEVVELEGRRREEGALR